MALIKSVKGLSPEIPNSCWLAENSTVVGDVKMGENCSVWFNAVIRGDVNSIRFGDNVNIQDGAVVHCTYENLATGKAGTKTLLGNNVSVGHNALVHGCTVGNNVLVGMGSIVMDNCVIEDNCIIAAGAVLLEGTGCRITMKKLKTVIQNF